MQDSGFMPRLVRPFCSVCDRPGFVYDRPGSCVLGVCELAWKAIIERKENNGKRQQPATVFGQEGPHRTVR